VSNSSLHTIEKGKLKIKLETATQQVFFDLTPYQAVNQLIHNCSIPTLYSPAGEWIEHVAGLGLDLRKVREKSYHHWPIKFLSLGVLHVGSIIVPMCACSPLQLLPSPSC